MMEKPFTPIRFSYHKGTSLIEVLVALVIVALGILGLAGLQARATMAEFESYQRSQAIVLASDMMERIRMNRAHLGSFKAISDASTGAGYLGTSGASSYALTCPPADPTDRAEADLCDWQDLLLGSSESIGSNKVGAMVAGRGCIFYDSTTELAGVPDSGLFRIAISWQGSQETVAPSINCANGVYAMEAKRRTIQVSFRLANLK